MPITMPAVSARIILMNTPEENLFEGDIRLSIIQLSRMDNFFHMKRDVVIIGAGPVGLFAGKLLSKEGIDVLILEEDQEIGIPVQCAGLVGEDVFEKFSLSKKSVLRKIDKIEVYSPSKKSFMADLTPNAYVIDRKIFDKELGMDFVRSGGELLLKTRCENIEVENDFVRVIAKGMDENFEIKSEIAIICEGARSELANRLGFPRINEYVSGLQYEVHSEIENVEVYLGKKIAPDFFAWSIPSYEGISRIGLCTKETPKKYLDNLLGSDLLRDRINRSYFEVNAGLIPLEPRKKTYDNRILLVGDTAGQVKPTTGGGVYYGMLCAKCAFETIKEAFETNQFSENYLKIYQDMWKKEIGWEIKVGKIFRKIYKRLEDKQIDALLDLLDSPEIQKIIEEESHFDRHGKLILNLLRSPKVIKIVGKAGLDIFLQG